MATCILDIENQLMLTDSTPVHLPIKELAWDTENVVNCKVMCNETNIGQLAVNDSAGNTLLFSGNEEQVLAWLQAITYSAITSTSNTDTITIELFDDVTKELLILKDISIEIKLPEVAAVRIINIGETLENKVDGVVTDAKELLMKAKEETNELLEDAESFFHYVENKLFGYNYIAIAKSVCDTLGVDPETITEDEAAVKLLLEYSIVCWNQKLPIEVICDKIVKN
jgi:hypothetical protein